MVMLLASCVILDDIADISDVAYESLPEHNSDDEYTQDNEQNTEDDFYDGQMFTEPNPSWDEIEIDQHYENGRITLDFEQIPYLVVNQIGATPLNDAPFLVIKESDRHHFQSRTTVLNGSIGLIEIIDIYP